MNSPFCISILLSIWGLLATKLLAQDSCQSENSADGPKSDVAKIASFLEFFGKLCENGMQQKKIPDDCRSICTVRPVDCEDIYQCGENRSGIYKIWPRSRVVEGSVNVFCDMDTDGGGWTVFQRRGDFGRSRDYFYKTWGDYKKGFGSLHQDFWLGNDILFALSQQSLYSLRVDLRSLENETRFATYDSFWIDDEYNGYKLHVTGYSGTAGDSLSEQNENSFTTKDRDNDKHKTDNCALKYKGGWWYRQCHTSNLNGLYLNGTFTTDADGLEWITWKGRGYSYPFVEMKIRSAQFALRREMMPARVTC